MEKKAVENTFKPMKLLGLKAYLKYRGIIVKGCLKPGLVAVARTRTVEEVSGLSRYSSDIYMDVCIQLKIVNKDPCCVFF